MKRFLILTASFGEGHNTAARNVAAGLTRLAGEDVEVQVRDLFAEAFGSVNEFTRKLYLFGINRVPNIWLRFYEMTDQNSDLHGSFRLTMGKLRSHLEKVLEEVKPTAIASTYPVYNYLFDDIQAERGGKLPFLRTTVVTDSISINRIWTRAGSDRFFIANQETAAVMEELGMDAEKMDTCGFPVQDAFLADQRMPKPEAGAEPRVLYIINSGKSQALDAIRALLQHPEIKLTVTVGRDKALKRQVLREVEGLADRVEVLGWTSEMPRLLMTHHVVLSKAGGATTQEAIAAWTPMLVTQVVPGQEEGNYDLLARNGCGALTATPQDMHQELGRMFAGDWERWRGMHQRIKDLSRPDAAGHIARVLLDA